ncbi:MAG: CPBP family intramembrane metalloprotease [Chloroflexota bacterium]|nr:CPBP family intramembrane metalloprotease [Chloroflexota bacterium]
MSLGGKLFSTGVLVAAVGTIPLALARPGGFRPQAGLRLGASGGVLLVGLAVALVGLFIYVFQPLAHGEDASRSAGTVRTVLAIFAVAVSLASLLGLPYVLLVSHGSSRIGPGGLVYLTAVSDLPLLIVVWLRVLRPAVLGWGSFGFSRRDLDKRVGQGLTGGIALFLAAAVAGAALSATGVRQNQFQRFEGVVGAPAGWFVLTLLAGSVLAPFAEEIFFRGYVFQTFLQRRGAGWAYLFSAALFAAAHLNVAAAVPIFVMGLILAFMFHRTGSLLPGIIAHGFNNALAFAALYTTAFRG